MSEFWIISVPGERDPDATFQKLHQELAKQNGLCLDWKFNIPMDFKVGTLDVLVGLSDELSKLDVYGEAVTKKLSQYMGDILEEQRHKLADNLVINGCNLFKFCHLFVVSPGAFLTKFQWDYAKYPVKQPLTALYTIISEQLTKIDSDLKVKSGVYNTIKSSLQTLERKQTGSLITRELGDIVKKEQFITDSEYLVTLVVVVPRNSYDDWKTNYEKMAPMVVPKSSELIFEDQDNGLWTVTLFKKIADDFKNRARELKFIVRDFVYNEKTIEESKIELSKLETDKKRQFAPLFRWLKVNFGECFSAMIHIKSLRIFVESVLRYGLPVNFQSILLQPNKKFHKRLRDFLSNCYSHLDGTSASSINDDEYNISAMGGTMDYYPYVCLIMELNMIEAH